MSKGKKKQPEAKPLARIFADHPLVDEELRFEFEGFARTLAELAWNPDNATPFTVVVRGGWGRGKTTLLRRTQWMLDHPGELKETPPEGVRTVRTLWFNAWKYPDDDTVLAGLLGEAIGRLRKSEKLIEQLRLFVDRYKGGALKALFSLAAPASLREQIAQGIDDRYRPVHEKRAFHDSFREMFTVVSRLMFDGELAVRDTEGLDDDQRWTQEKQRREVLAIFLDDLDRCREERVVEVLEAVNLFLDLPGVCFFLGIDWERLVRLLPETVQDQGTEFLEKVVQVAFELPEVSEDSAQDYVSGLLEGTALATVLGGDEDDPQVDVKVLARALKTRHPRHVKRFLNDLSIGLAVLRNTGKLGGGKDQLPEAAVVAWHLLGEILTVERWRELRARPQNLRRFLLEMAELESKEEAAETPGADPAAPEEVPEEWRRIHRSGLPARHLKQLRGLSDRQRYLLVHLATPPTVEVAQGPRLAVGKQDLLDPASTAWVEIPAGTFLMGARKDRPGEPGHDPEAYDDESPVHEVELASYRLSRHPVTNAEYAVFVQETGKRSPEHWEGGAIPEGLESHPVVHVSWQDAVAFSEWLTRRFSAGGDFEVGLPTEAQWEFAARGEEGRRYPWGYDQPDAERANFAGNVGDTTPVGSYPAGQTPEGVHDLAGNVWEWCHDWSGPYATEKQSNPTGLSTGSSRVLRGGAFNYVPWDLRASYRNDNPPEYRYHDVGFRLRVSSSGGLGQ